MNIDHYHTYQVAISPDLGINAEEFAIAWNAGTRDLTTAHFAEEKVSWVWSPRSSGPRPSNITSKPC